MKKILLILFSLVLMLSGCQETDRAPVEEPQAPPVPETLSPVDYVCQTGETPDSTLYLLIKEETATRLYRGSLSPESNFELEGDPLYSFDPAFDPLYLDYREEDQTFLFQSDTKVRTLDLDTLHLSEAVPLPEEIEGKVLLNRYQPEGYLYTKFNTLDESYDILLGDAAFENELDLFQSPLRPRLIAVNDPMTRILFETAEGLFIRNLAENTLSPREPRTVLEAGLSEETLLSFDLKTPLDFNERAVYEGPKGPFDRVIKGGILFDPEGETIRFGYDIGIFGDTIAAISPEPLTGDEIVEARGLIVAPGFIDMLSFNPNATGAYYKIGDGVTTNLSMHGCTNDFDNFFSYYERNPIMVNYGGAVFMVQIRYEAGLGHYYEPSENQVDYIARRTEEEILAGGLGLAFSPEYYPGTTPEEILGAMAMAKKYDLATHFHARYSAMTGEHTSIDGVVEILEYARALDAHVHFMHLHSTGGTHVMTEALEMIHTAREEGHTVTFDIYPYDSWATNIGSARFNGDWQGKFGITYGDLQIAGTEDFVTEENFQSLRDAQRIVVAYAMDDKEVIMALRDEGSMIGSDSIVETDPSFNHFRGSGAFSRFIGRYVRDLDIMPLMEGIRKTSYYTARQLEGISEDMALRGRLREETVADITIFDYSSIIDTSSAAVPASLSEGVAYVLVSGQIVKDPETIHTDRKFGQPIANDLRP